MNNALSALGGSGRASQIGGGSDIQGADRSGGRDKDFAKLLGGGGSARTTAPKPAARETAKAAQGADKDQADKRPAAADDSANDPARSAQAGDKVAQDNEKSSTETKASSKDKARTEDKGDDAKPDDGAWPPAGLAGIGLGLLPAIGAAVLPAASATPLGAAAGLAVGVAGAVANGVGALLGGDAAAQTAAGATDPNAATAGSAAATAGTAPASAAGGFGALLLAQAGSADKAGGGDTAAPLAALAAIAAAAGGKTGESGDAAPAADPSAIVPTAATAPLHATTRLTDPQPFTGSPTPTPNLHGNQFDEELGARISWLADQKIGHAHIKLNPAELGPVEVRLHMTGDQVNASFSSAQADVRQALENSLPRLRDMLGQHGFQLGQADVGQQQPQQQQANPQGTSQGGSSLGGSELGDDLSGSVGIPSVVLRQRGLLDAYA